MRIMKDSGIAWIGEIPIDWHKNKVFRIFDIIGSGTTPKSNNEQNFIGTIKWIQSGDINGAELFDCKTSISENAFNSSSALKIYRAPYIIIAMYGASVGNISISNIDACVNQACCVLGGRVYNLKYAYYALKTAKDYLVWKAVGGGQPNISQDTIKQLWLPDPSQKAKERIARFLDIKCSHIDSVIEKTRAAIEEYKKLKQAVITQAVTKGIRPKREMKDSGIEWIGEIPKEWVCEKFKYIARVKANLVHPDGYGDYQQVSPENIEKGTGKILPCKTVKETGVISDNHLFQKGQILYSKIRPILNKVAIAPFDGLCSADMYPIETDINKYYLLYALLSDSYLVNIRLITEDRVKMPKINQEELSNIFFAIPEESEQSEIVAYLDEKTAAIDSLIQKKEQLITELEAYKKSLIYEYVTGKKEVYNFD